MPYLLLPTSTAPKHFSELTEYLYFFFSQVLEENYSSTSFCPEGTLPY